MPTTMYGIPPFIMFYIADATRHKIWQYDVSSARATLIVFSSAIAKLEARAHGDAQDPPKGK